MYRYGKMFLFVILVSMFVVGMSAGCGGVDQGAIVQKDQEITQLGSQLDQAKKEIDVLKKSLGTANAMIQELKATPEQKYEALVDSSNNVGTPSEAEGAIDQIDAFVEKNPGHKLAGTARRLKATLQKKKKVLEEEASRRAADEAVAELKGLLANITDGSDLDLPTVRTVIDKVKQSYSLAVLKKMPQTSYKEATKDADAARGKILSLRGRVIQISKVETGLYEGVMLQNYDAVKYLALGSTEGIFEDSWAQFIGVFTQRYSYANAGGGTTHSVVVVGYFDVPQNR